MSLKLWNDHTGTGYIIFKKSETEIKKINFCVGKDNKIYLLNNNLHSIEINLNELVLTNISEI